MAKIGAIPIGEKEETPARTLGQDGFRAFQLNENVASALTADEHGHLLVRMVTQGGVLDTGGGVVLTPKYIRVARGSAPQQNNDGLIGIQRIMQRPGVIGVGGVAGSPYIGRLFGFCDAAGFVQIIMKDESAVDPNPPVGGDVPEVVISLPSANLNFSFGEYLIGANTTDLATYLVFSSTGPTFTPAGNHCWYYFVGSV